MEAGPLTSIAVSADHQVIAGGHANGSIFTWNIAKTTYPFLHIPSLDASQLTNRTQNGHMPNAAVRHLGFLGMRHTALVSADESGMAFSHLATRGLGNITRSIKTTRILGRYPSDTANHGKSRTPSTILAFSPLPLGNIERGTDTMGLTAILTPHLLVVISTTPIAQTQFKTGKPKDFDTQNPLSGCLSWFPAVNLKFPDAVTGKGVSNTKLAYCWSNILTILEVDEIEYLDRSPSLSFNARSRWKCEEAIVAVQWLGRSILVLLTITQRLIILEDGTMRVAEVLDLLNKHIYKEDIFSKPLKSLVKQSDTFTPPTNVTVSDAYHMSFKVYKSRIFLLGLNHISIGTLSDWADRIIATMRNGDHVGAILLATSCYTGDVDKIMIGLPEDSNSRHLMVRDKLIETIKTSLDFVFASWQEQLKNEKNDDYLRNLAEACSEACLHIENNDLLFGDVYESFENGDSSGIFFKALEPHILEERITVIPPAIVKKIIAYYVSQECESRLEEIICHINPSSLDIDQVTTLCRQHNLYDAFIYVWNRAISDYVTPLIELLTTLISLTPNENSIPSKSVIENNILNNSAVKIFPYMSYTFTGRIYPTGEPLADQETFHAKSQLYWFLFSGQNVEWPKDSGSFFLTQRSLASEPTFPYLRMILKFDAPSFLSVLNEAFEDSFLNGISEQIMNGIVSPNLPTEQHLGISINRQYIISILLEVMNPSYFQKEDMIYLDMFIARNIPKFPQYILIPSSTVHKVLIGLCNYPAKEIADDAQLSAEYLLSIYRPADLQMLLPLFQRAGFFRVLKSIYKSEKQFCKLLETYFEDFNDQDLVYECICDCLRLRSDLTKRQISDIHKVLVTHAPDLLHLNSVRTAEIIDSYAPQLHRDFMEAISGEPNLQFLYLQTLYEERSKNENLSNLPVEFLGKYVQLMCKFKPQNVASYIEKVQISHLCLDQILPHMEENGVIDAAVFLMTRDGQFEAAMNRLIKHIKKLEASFLGIISSSAEDTRLVNRDESISGLLEALLKYTNVGIWLCQIQTNCASHHPSTSKKKQMASTETMALGKLLPEESLWLDLIDASIKASRNLSINFESFCESNPNWKSQCDLILGQLRTPVQCIFSSLLVLTSTKKSARTSLSFIRILRAFLTRAAVSLPNLTDLRAVLASVFSAYTYEEKILQLTKRLLERDLFINVQSAISSRERGWAPRIPTCEACGGRLWGASVSSNIYSKWEERETMLIKNRRERSFQLAGGFVERGKAPVYHRCTTSNTNVKDVEGESSGKSNSGEEKEEDANEALENHHQTDWQHAHLKKPELGPLVVLACRHTYHQSCLERIQGEENAGLEGREFKCPIDG